MNIRQLSAYENPPMELLLLADPSQKLVEEYLKRGSCFVAEIRNQLIGVHVLLPTRPQTIEIGTGNSSIGQLALYQKCGFRIVGVDLNFFLRHYEEDIIENGIRCTDMIRLSQDV
ncbi:GNAT family N-acetyltransferase [Exiguobacterium artemiae]